MFRQNSIITRMGSRLLLALALVHAAALPLAPAAANDYPEDDISATEVLPSDGVPWEVQKQPDRVVAISDIHGDLNALLHLLSDRGLINAQGEWTGGKTHLVIVGDVNDRGTDTRLIYDLIMRLEVEALSAGGAVHTLLGNHDVATAMGGIYETSMAEKALFARMPNTTAGQIVEDYQRAMSGQSKYAQWIRSRNTILKIGDSLFVHAGLMKEWVFKHRPDEINATIRAWVAYTQGVGPAPPAQTQWVLGMNGPLLTRLLSHGRVNPDIFQILLKKWGARRLVVGHDITSGFTVETPPRYQGSLIKIDTAMSFATDPRGNPAALEIQGKQITTHHLSRPKTEHPYYAETKKRLWPPVDVVINPDDVIWRVVPKQYTPVEGEQILEIQGFRWALNREALPFLKGLARQSNIRVSFFSDALPQRDIALLKQIQIPGFGDAVKLAQGRILSGTHVVPSQSTGYRKKDLRMFAQIGREIDLDRAVLIDSNPDAAAKGQDAGFVHIPDQGGNPELLKVLRILEAAFGHSANGEHTFSEGIALAASRNPFESRQCQKPAALRAEIGRIQLVKRAK